MLAAAAQIIQPARHGRVDESATGPREIIHVQDVAHRLALERQAQRPPTLDCFDVMRDETIFISFGRPRVDIRKTKNTRPKVSLRRIIFDKSFGDQL